jgi:uncharacterized coiled-coil protein SlyX
MLLNEFLKEHKPVEAQQVTMAELQATVAQQQKGMDALGAQVKEQGRGVPKSERPNQREQADQQGGI